MKGYKHSDEIRKKISAGRLKRKALLGYLNSPDTRKKMSQAGQGHVVLDKTKEKIRAFQKGRIRSQETRKKIGAFHKARPRPNERGSKSVHWKGGVTPLNAVIRTSLEYRLVREACFERDNFTCIWCGQHGGKLNADHIKPFAHYPELRLALDNLRTLCVPCHKTTDTFGRKSHK